MAASCVLAFSSSPSASLWSEASCSRPAGARDLNSSSACFTARPALSKAERRSSACSTDSTPRVFSCSSRFSSRAFSFLRVLASSSPPGVMPKVPTPGITRVDSSRSCCSPCPVSDSSFSVSDAPASSCQLNRVAMVRERMVSSFSWLPVALSFLTNAESMRFSLACCLACSSCWWYSFALARFWVSTCFCCSSRRTSCSSRSRVCSKPASLRCFSAFS